MRRKFIGPFHRFALDVQADGSAQVWDAERTDAKGRATLAHTAPDAERARAWVKAEIAADPSMVVRDV
jgi:hypothetical protein